MKKLLTTTVCFLTLCLPVLSVQETSSQPGKNTPTRNSKRGPVFRATKDQITQAQTILKARGFFKSEPTGTLDSATRDALRDYQKAEGLKITGTLNKITLEKMAIPLTEKQKVA